MSIAPGTLDYSIVICTYNPDERILSRCLQAVSQLSRTDLSAELILVDNNSATTLDTLPYVQKYLTQIPGARYLFVAEQGHVYARMAAIEAAKGKYIVYFDDDNEPESDYLQQLKNLNRDYPQVAAWGPGNIWVDFIDGIDPALMEYALPFFQERHETNVAYASIRNWQSCYPYGTGMCISTLIQKEYVRMLKQGYFTQHGRSGNLLTCGDDLQMVLLCIRNGYAAGTAPALKLKHIIPAKRANFNYLQRLIYSCVMSSGPSVLQVFPEKKKEIEQQIMAPRKFSRQVWKKYIKAKWSGKPTNLLSLASFIAEKQSPYEALDKAVPKRVIRLLQRLDLIKS